MDKLKKSLGVIFLVILGLITLIMPASADVKVTITRDLPNERQHIVQQFPDMDGFEMRMQQRYEFVGSEVSYPPYFGGFF